MADFTFSMPDGEDAADTLIKLYKTLSVMFSNLDSKNVKELETGKTKISSGDGLCEISGAQILMRDKSGEERLTIGADESGNFVFVLKNADGDEALTLSSEGEAVFKGDIKTGKNAEVGNSLYLGRSDKSAGKKVLQFYDDESDLEKVRLEAEKDEKGYVKLKIIADTITLSSFDGVRDGYGHSFVTTNFKPYIEIDEARYYVKFE